MGLTIIIISKKGPWQSLRFESLNFLHFLFCEATFLSTERTNFPGNEVPQFPIFFSMYDVILEKDPFTKKQQQQQQQQQK